MNFSPRHLFRIIKTVDKPDYHTLKDSDKLAIRNELMNSLEALLSSDKRSGNNDYPNRRDEIVEQLLNNIIFRGDEREQFRMYLQEAIDSLK